MSSRLTENDINLCPIQGHIIAASCLETQKEMTKIIARESPNVETKPATKMGPTMGRERHVVLDAFRGLA